MDNDDIANALFNSLRSIKMQMVNCTEDINSLKCENNELKRTVVLLHQQLQQQSTEICSLQKNMNACVKKKVFKQHIDTVVENTQNQTKSVEFCLPKLRTLVFNSLHVNYLSSNVLKELYKCRRITLSYCYFLTPTYQIVMQVIILQLHPIREPHAHAGYFKQLRELLKQCLQKVYDQTFDFGKNYTYITPQKTYKYSTDFLKDLVFYNHNEMFLHSSNTSMLIPEQCMTNTNDIWLENSLLCHRMESKYLPEF